MKDLVLVAVFVVLTGIGCSGFNPFSDKTPAGGSPATSNRSLEEKAIDTVVGEEKIGIPECDAVFEKLAAELNNPDDGYIAKATKAVVLNKIKENIRISIEENKGDKAKLARDCLSYAEQIDKFKAEQENKGK